MTIDHMEIPKFADRHGVMDLRQQNSTLQLHRKYVVKVECMAVNRRCPPSKLALVIVPAHAVAVQLRSGAHEWPNMAGCPQK